MKRDRKQNGFILIVSLVFLMIMTMLGIAMFGGFTMDERMSGNHREKNRARDAAQAALLYAGYWLAQPGNSYAPGQSNVGTTCTAPSVAPLVCSNALANPTTPPWAAAVNYTAPNSAITVNASGGQNTYVDNPKYYIQYLGNTNSTSAMYQVTSTAQGGNATAVSVVQAVYQVTATATDIGGG